MVVEENEDALPLSPKEIPERETALREQANRADRAGSRSSPGDPDQ